MATSEGASKVVEPVATRPMRSYQDALRVQAEGLGGEHDARVLLA
jgi:hypothetical protein